MTRQLDDENAAFWTELCGTGLARSLGINGRAPGDLERFDAAYLGFYPYLSSYLDGLDAAGKRVLEIGLGYGTVGSYLVTAGADYHGLDISPAPVDMMRHRLRLAGVPRPDAAVVTGSALAVPHPDASFDAVVSIGCLHHTGDLAGGIREVARVLRRGGTALLMVYNRHSFRRLATIPAARARRSLLRTRLGADDVRAMYDSDTAGSAAPHTDFATRGELRALLQSFHEVAIEARNADPLTLRGRPVVPRSVLLPTLGRWLGLDLYVLARR